jgi:hypothetical protein
MPHQYDLTDFFEIPKEAFTSGITDAYTFNAAMDRIDDILGNAGTTWKATVINLPALPLVGNTDGDARIVLADHSLWIWNTSLNIWQSPFGASVYAGSFEQPVVPTVLQIPDGWWGWWYNNVTAEMWLVRNRAGVMWRVELAP